MHIKSSNIIEQIAEYGITKENIRAFGIWDINIKLLKWLGFIEK